MERQDLTFESGGEQCAAWLYMPAGDGPRPAVVLAHGFGGVRAARLWAFAERFAAAGVAAVVFDYRGFGGGGGGGGGGPLSQGPARAPGGGGGGGRGGGGGGGGGG